MSRQNTQSMKPATAAKKLDVYLPATPAAFQENPITRDELAALQAEPPQWLQDLRKNGPHPKNLVAARLGISISGLQRAGVGESLTTEQITGLLADPPQWLIDERASLDAVRADEQRVAQARAARNRPSRK
ncbi:hypothetical protein HWD35_03110 [Tsukamurella tyrosinosolvens]|uniref:Uncharacterized protein n=1 Tax=Tsukamurella tyrosinosolvens TaxID=57704 RepID=A0A1H4SAG1_TSUTY|nr:DUF5997 family protein [Tsukamurella tyrosinosolvens]AUN40262.1 hypothetical protein ASU32_09840 [Tsukamurella tyrosinosolvens]KXO93521.1 hypothetical protein AXK58_17015 [Tsukamurella tyrosinosolvens]KXP05710.1 hypothetical protein AXK59_09345 [Tsukamurella tyrosinosolvens]KZL95529.1 hypothetical protein AXX05_20370 [Tsukamurella tyrosinosolvens]MCA4993690.1 hypothetical protein [Tsukamurella tyrosinosolvens]